MEKFADIISHVTHPPIVALIGNLVLSCTVQTANSHILLILTWIFASLVPLIGIWVFARDAFKKHLILERKKRTKPFTVAILSYFIGFVILVLMGAPPIFSGLMFSFFFNTIIMTFINARWKISVHASGVATATTTLVYHFAHPFAPLLLAFTIPVCWSRVELKAHTKLQVVAGAVITILLTWVQLTLLIPVL